MAAPGLTMPNPWTIIGWLVLLALVVVVFVVVSTWLQMQADKAGAAVVRTADVPPDARPAGAREPLHGAPS